MTTDPKAPPQALASASEALPDEINAALNTLVSYAPWDENLEKACCAASKLRAHIAAQRNEVEQMAESIAEYKEVADRLQDLYESSRAREAKLEAEKETAAKLIRKYSDGGVSLFNRLKELEADNKRLREALQFYADHDWEDAERFNQNARPNPHDLALPARAALAQHDASCASTEQKPAQCKTCEGCGKELNPAGSPLFRDCSDCNGTGREVK